MRKINKILSLFIVMILFINFIPTRKVQAVDDINIISSTFITKEAAKEWARSKGGTETFISLADLFWKYSSSHGNVNPAVAYVQAALETGYGKFGGLLDESYHNTCGMKITVTSGDSDNIAEQHYRFNSWDEGVQAHLDHLALYAGATGYPRSNTYDPRHFKFITGTAKTVQDLEGKWATASQYGQKLMNLYNSLQDVFNKSLSPIICIDTPKAGITVNNATLEVSGWSVNGSGVKSIDIYVDGTLDGKATIGVERLDVQQAYPQYPNSNLSGYKYTLDLSKYSNGQKVIEIVQTGNDDSISKSQVRISYYKDIPRGYIDTPSNNENISGHYINVTGWALNSSGISKVEVYVDGKYIKDATIGLSRPDVKKVYPHYINAENSGFKAKLNVDEIPAGSKLITLKQIGNDGSYINKVINVNINKLNPIICVDTPSNNSIIKGNSLTVSGWAINDSGIKNINVYINGNLVANTTATIKRSDVKKAYPQYSYSEDSGFRTSINLSDMSGGTKIVVVEQIGNDGSKLSKSFNIIVDKPIARQYIDEPVSGKNESSNSLKVRGWSLNNNGISRIEIYVDNILLKSTNTGVSRPDVKKVYPEYNNAEISGYETIVDISSISSGRKELKVVQVSKNGEELVSSTIINIEKLDNKLAVDKPIKSSSLSGDTFVVEGWALASSGVNRINIYVDNKLLKTTSTNILRNDVYNVYPQYGDKNSGYKTTIDLSSISSGERVLKVEMVDNNGIKTSSQFNINVKKPAPILCIDTPTNGMVVKDNYLTVSGWAIAYSKIAKVNIYIDNVLVSNTQLNVVREDVYNAYKYPNSKNSGYSTIIDISKYSTGNHKVKVEAVMDTGEKIALENSVLFKKVMPKQYIDYPLNGESTSGKFSIKGWSLNPNGVDRVQIYIDGSLVSETTTGLLREDVYNAFPEYNDKKSGFLVENIDLSLIPAGIRNVEVRQIGKDGSNISSSFAINVVKKENKLYIDAPVSGQKQSSNILYIRGWALNESGIKSISVYIDDVFVKNISLNEERKDVNLTFPGYKDGVKSGFNNTIDLSGYKFGQHKLKIVTKGNDGSYKEESVQFSYDNNRKTIVVDPGHNYGGDEGAIGYIDNIPYYERDLNMKVSLYLKGYLEDYGYNVIMTRYESDRDKVDLNTSLNNRINIANNANADVFISVHHNSFTSNTAKGCEVFYYNDKENISKMTASKKLATDSVNNISKSTGFYNRGAKEYGYKVLKGTKMPGVLVEGGFMSNPNELVSLLNDTTQRSIAKGIADAVKVQF